MPKYKQKTTALPDLGESQLRFRLGLVRQRTRTYPLDSMDFIMMDLERPDTCHRHAHWCTGDMTGRLLEFLSHAEGVDGQNEPRLPELFERILRQRRQSGLIGRYAALPKPIPPEDDFRSGVPRLLPGLLRYYDLTGDARALEAAVGMAQFTLSRKDEWWKHLRNNGARCIEAWVSEPMSMLYGLTGDNAYIDFTAMIEECLESPEKGVHSHGFLSTLCGLQVAALITGDNAWNVKVERYRQTIIERHYEMPDGGIPEGFPPGQRNEGCSIADWIMVNLNAGLITGDETAYTRAEHSLWNALAFNQWITGSFGTREITAAGYGLRYLEEAVWCCLHNGGLAIAEYARQAVAWRDGSIHINLLVPGKYRLPIPGKPDAEVRILTYYPNTAATVIEVRPVLADVNIRLRIPTCVRRPIVSETRDADMVCIRLNGALTHHIEQCSRGRMLYYGPLVLVPLGYNWSGGTASDRERANAPAGYIPNDMPQGLPELQVDTGDIDSLLHLGDQSLPDWTYFDEGPGARCAVQGSVVNVPVKFPDGQARTLRFVPECYFTSCLALHETPIVFG
ncbi:hypothetical protein FJZ31_29520 [Candidatus Poribacteria bacterium]|nr:hypothetical protein [Candidatus Poribacteria bacterium]